jgi:hypothetical protein
MMTNNPEATESASRPARREAIGAMTFRRRMNRLAVYTEPDGTISVYQSNAMEDRETLTAADALQLVQDHLEYVHLLTRAIQAAQAPGGRP